ncbi:GH92 family glycosyl hydrolase [Maribellus maritimus]|uniref:GH92 family glycosyl hydrolase n=1 Tax=Maribellus maritimus TaxID=2870838 RepID=UPI001EEBDDA1|nr:GH92 family glycosyl hydrolase [Maribellus maritimus]MCG6188462.1 GH92 family glycosyl hydrolase [Maribellus maritimus]
MKKYILAFVAVSFLAACAPKKNTETLSTYVNPFIGTDAHGHTYPGPLMPWGMVQLSPDTGNEDWDWCSGYHSSDNSIMGFSHKHLSGTGIPDMGDILLMPMTGEPKFEPGSKENPDGGYRSRFSKEKEHAKPGYYSVTLDDYGVEVELTASNRVGVHRYTFNNSKNNSGWIIIDLGHGLSDKSLFNHFEISDDSKVSGYRHSTAFVKNQHVFFTAEFSKPFKSHISLIDGIKGSDKKGEGEVCKLALQFDVKANEEIIVKVGISNVDEAGAENNISKEMPGWNFDKIASDAALAWENNLSKIKIDCNDSDEKTIFYTAFYHNMISPNLISDADGRYRGWDGEVHKSTQEFYTNYSLWDTYRGVHPFVGLMFPEMDEKFINSMLQRYKEIGELPINEYGINETFAMIGHHAIPVLADAMINGFGKFDKKLAYKAAKHAQTTDDFNMKADWEKYMRYGYLPSDSIIVESVSRTLEFAYNDWCVAQMAKYLGYTEDAQYFTKRSQFYRNVFDEKTKLMRGRNSDGAWVTPFDKFKVSHAGTGGGDYTEANAWQYTWHVQHDIPGLINLMGGSESFVTKLDSLFAFNSDVYGDGLTLDVTGLIGQYAHGNEPCHHVPYLYNVAGVPWKTQERVSEIKNTLYHNSRDGLCGNDDCGQLSVWYLWGALGFYPVCPGDDYYLIGSPSFPKATLELSNGKTFVVGAQNATKQNIYIQSMELNGQDYSNYELKVKDVLAGGQLDFVLAASPK